MIIDRIINLPGCAFKYSVATSAPRHTIWQLWSDVENWKMFDTRLEYSFLYNGTEFEMGAIGYIKSKGAPKTRFELTEVIPGERFTETLILPLYQSLELKRYFETTDSGGTIFTHEVRFKGSLRWFYYLVLNKAFKKDLPLVMNAMKALAETPAPKN